MPPAAVPTWQQEREGINGHTLLAICPIQAVLGIWALGCTLSDWQSWATLSKHSQYLNTEMEDCSQFLTCSVVGQINIVDQSFFGGRWKGVWLHMQRDSNLFALLFWSYLCINLQISAHRCVCRGLLPCRYYGRKMLFCMMTHPDFDKTLEKYVPAKDLPYIKEFVNNLHQKVCRKTCLTGEKHKLC